MNAMQTNAQILYAAWKAEPDNPAVFAALCDELEERGEALKLSRFRSIQEWRVLRGTRLPMDHSELWAWMHSKGRMFYRNSRGSYHDGCWFGFVPENNLNYFAQIEPRCILPRQLCNRHYSLLNPNELMAVFIRRWCHMPEEIRENLWLWQPPA